MNREIFVTCAVTGAGDTVGRSPKVPVAPAEIAQAAIEAARAGAAIAHIHVRDLRTGKGARDPDLYRRGRGTNPFGRCRSSPQPYRGNGGDLVLGSGENPLPHDPDRTDLVGPLERLAHIEALLPEICTLDCGSMNFAAGGDYAMVNTPASLMTKAKRVQALGVRPELEVFDTGHLVFVHEMIKAGVLDRSRHVSAGNFGLGYSRRAAD